MDIDVLLPNDKVMHVPVLGTHCHTFPASQSLPLGESEAHFVGKTVEADVRIS